MKDHELIELAATAAGIKYDADASKPKEGRKWWGLWKTFDREPSEYDKRYWNPLCDDGDALRLAVKLELFDLDRLLVDLDIEDAKTATNRDPYEATRRAIVLAASKVVALPSNTERSGAERPSGAASSVAA